ncbi:MAG: hypothetical protein LC650_05055 [Actinobacteria bacterium]|nr:hypothetical protein [Actinomycetota bacterium]
MRRFVYVEALDHFSSDSNDKRCVAGFVGEVVGEDDVYLRLRHVKADVHDSNSAEETHNVLKGAIVTWRELRRYSDEVVR